MLTDPEAVKLISEVGRDAMLTDPEAVKLISEVGRDAMLTDPEAVKLISEFGAANMVTDPEPVTETEDFECDVDPELIRDLLDDARRDELEKERKRVEAQKAFALGMQALTKLPDIVKVDTGICTDAKETKDTACATDVKTFTDSANATEVKELKDNIMGNIPLPKKT